MARASGAQGEAHSCARLRLTAACALGLLLAACAGSGDDADPGATGVEIRAVTLVRGDATWPAAQYIVRSEAEWAAAWASRRDARLAAQARPSVDFSTRMLVGLSAGVAPEGCSALLLERVTEDAVSLRVAFRQLSPSAGTACPAVITPLVNFAVMPRSDKPVRFEVAHATVPEAFDDPARHPDAPAAGTWGDGARASLESGLQSTRAEVDCHAFGAAFRLAWDRWGNAELPGRVTDGSRSPTGGTWSADAVLHARRYGDEVLFLIIVPQTGQVAGPVTVRAGQARPSVAC